MFRPRSEKTPNAAAADPRTVEHARAVLYDDITVGDGLKRLVYEAHREWTESLPGGDSAAVAMLTGGYLGALTTAKLSGELPINLTPHSETAELITLHTAAIDQALALTWDDMVAGSAEGGIARDLLEAASVRLSFVLGAQFGLSSTDMERLASEQSAR